MKGYYVLIILVAVLMLASSAFAYGGFSNGWNRYYYTANYQPNVYYPTPASVYYYPAYYGTYQVYQPAPYYYPYYSYYYPSTYYTGAGFTVSVCAYYGYC